MSKDRVLAPSPRDEAPLSDAEQAAENAWMAERFGDESTAETPQSDDDLDLDQDDERPFGTESGRYADDDDDSSDWRPDDEDWRQGFIDDVEETVRNRQEETPAAPSAEDIQDGHTLEQAFYRAAQEEGVDVEAALQVFKRDYPNGTLADLADHLGRELVMQLYADDKITKEEAAYAFSQANKPREDSRPQLDTANLSDEQVLIAVQQGKRVSRSRYEKALNRLADKPAGRSVSKRKVIR